MVAVVRSPLLLTESVLLRCGFDPPQGNTIITDPSFENHRWITPARGDPDWQPSYQDYSRLVGNAHVVYNQNRSLATVTVRTQCLGSLKQSTRALS